MSSGTVAREQHCGTTLARSRLDSSLAPSLKRALTSSSMHTLHSSEYITLSMQNAASLTHARHLQQAVNLRARQYYKITFIEDQEDLEIEEDFHDIEALMVKVEGLKDDAEQKEVLQKDVSDRPVEDKPSVVGVLVRQRDVTSL